jgi:hypothetical protein
MRAKVTHLGFLAVISLKAFFAAKRGQKNRVQHLAGK